CLIGVFECMIDAGLPKEVANLVMGSAGEISDEFMSNPAVRKISFTGSTEVGRILMAQSAPTVKKMSHVSLEGII
ncbi:MAG TPA: aldehyde dehydrogenase family protein, partial [Methanoregulaceae archaeon]|nr:aldehyde dehydrogenase family protein [Methanoregulaceae archaeon]